MSAKQSSTVVEFEGAVWCIVGARNVSALRAAERRYLDGTGSLTGWEQTMMALIINGAAVMLRTVQS